MVMTRTTYQQYGKQRDVLSPDPKIRDSLQVKSDTAKTYTVIDSARVSETYQDVLGPEPKKHKVNKTDGHFQSSESDKTLAHCTECLHEDEDFRSNMKTFHQSMQMTIYQCIICNKQNMDQYMFVIAAKGIKEHLRSSVLRTS